MKHMNFELTDEQITQLKPLFDEAEEADLISHSNRGMILLRLDKERSSEAVFLPCKYAIKINELMRAFKEEEKN